MIARLARLVAIPSISREERAIADTLGTELREAGLRVQRERNNLWCEIGDAARPRLLLNSHLDTVPPGQSWASDPRTPRLDEGRLTGLGANDAKGCVVALIEAALATRRRLDRGERLGGTVVLALTAEEEISGAGLGTILRRLRPLDAALVGEPTGLVPMVAQRGLLVLRGVARGRSGHPANTPTGEADNAILAAASDLVRLREFDWGPRHPLLGRCHAHVTMVNGGVARNVIPDRCEFCLDIRTTPLESHAHLFQRLCDYLRSDLHVHSDRLVPVETDRTAPIVQAVLRALPGAELGGSSAMSDMVFLAGIPSVKLGPGQSRRSHAPDEYILLDELRDGAAAYERIIQEYFGVENRVGSADATAVPQAVACRSQAS
ncbi:MAG: M20/M25/M40 family metallo-hydrolase [Planctomycetes bacterium]|nr:M20/M25/M40 family metallo-hydrolase [Planctomycetota bacterium]